MSAIASSLNAAIEQAIDALLQLDPQTRDRLLLLEGKLIAVNVTRPDLAFAISVVDQRVNVTGKVDTPADTTLTGSLSGFRSLSSGNEALYKGDVSIEGDLHVGQQLKDIIANLDPDWEEFLSPVLGDALVHQLALASQSISVWLDRTRSSLQQNTSEYLQEEAELVAPNSEICDFCLEVDVVRASTDRLEARVKRLELLEMKSKGDGAC